MLRVVGWAGIGLCIGGIILIAIGPPGAGIWAMPVGMAVAFFGLFFAAMRRATPQGFRRALRAARGTDADAVRAARDAGHLGVARIDDLRQTGLEVNDQPMCELDLTVRPASGRVFTATVQRLVLITEIPRFQPGRRVVVAILPGDGPTVELLPDDPDAEPWAGLEVPPAAETGEFVAPPSGGPRSMRLARKQSGNTVDGSRSGARLLGAALAVLGLIVGVAVVLVPHGATLAQTVAAIPGGRLTADHRKPEIVAQAVAAMSAEAGHDRLMGAAVHDSLITFEVPLVPDEKASDDWTYRRGSLEHRGAALIQPEFAAEQFSASEVAWDRIWPALEEASRQVGISDLSEAYVSVGRDLVVAETEDSPGGWTGPVRVYMQLADDYRKFSFEMNADGTGLTLTSPQ